MDKAIMRVLTGITLAGVLLGTYFSSPHLFAVLFSLVLCIILLFEWPKLAASNRKLWLLVPFYPVFPVVCLIYLSYAYRSVDIWLPLYPFLVSGVADTFAYIAGNLWGTHKIIPRISPKKSWEGLAGGFVGTLLLNWLFVSMRPAFAVFYLTKNAVQLVVISLIFALVAFAGDMFVSFLKRRANLKDISALLPGHGGLLDRLDSVFFVVVFLIGLLFVAP